MTSDLGKEYDALKKAWETTTLEIFLKYFPKARESIDFVDISTPLSAEDYLSAYRGF